MDRDALIRRLRVLVAIDAALFIVCNMPLMRDNDLVSIVLSIGTGEGWLYDVGTTLWLAAFIMIPVSWGLLLSLVRWARIFYAIPGVLICAYCLVQGGTTESGIFAAAGVASYTWYGICLGQLFGGPLASLYRRAPPSVRPAIG